jgi:thiol-disulfide isomerase/thioredoxin
MKKVFILLLFLLLLGGCGREKNFEDEYPAFADQEHVYRLSTYDEVVSALTVAEGVNVVLFGFKTCPYCQLTMPLINQAALATGIEAIYYLDIKDIRDQKTAEYLLLVGYLDSKVEDLDVRDGQKRLTVPDLYVIKDGEILSHRIATFKTETGYLLDLTDQEKEDLLNIYKQMFSEALSAN